MKLTGKQILGYLKGNSGVVRPGDCCGRAGRVTLPARKRLNHRGPLSIDVSSAWYFITGCAAERCDYGRAVSMKPPGSCDGRAVSMKPPGSCDGRAVSMKPPPTPFMVHASAILDAARFRHVRGKWRLALFLVMPDHLHFIVHFPSITSDAAVSSKPPYRGMELVIADFKRWLSTKCGLRFQRDFFDTRLRDDAHFAEKYTYILGNPVRKGLCAMPEEWSYSIAFSRVDGGIIDAALPSDVGRAVSMKPPGSCDGRAVSIKPVDSCDGRAVSMKPPDACDGMAVSMKPPGSCNGMAVSMKPPGSCDGRAVSMKPPGSCNGRAVSMKPPLVGSRVPRDRADMAVAPRPPEDM